MALLKEKVRIEDWEFFNSLNIQYSREHITANQYSSWVIDKDRGVIFTRVHHSGRDFGRGYILIWGESRTYIYVETRPTELNDGTKEYRWLIEYVEAPICLKEKRDELLNLIREVAIIQNQEDDGWKFTLVSIAEPKYI